VALGVEEVRAGGPGGGFDDHYAALYRPLVRYCRRITQVAEPEDLAQEALLRAWPSYDEGKDMWPLVVTIARRIAIDEHRRSLRGEVRNHVEAAFRPSPLPSPEEMLELHEEVRLARRALNQLSPRYQRMIRLRDIDERSYTDIAQLEGTSLDVARSTLRRARAALRAAYGRASEGAAAAFGLREWAARRSGRVQAMLGPLGNQGFTSLVGAVVVIAVAAGIASTPKGSTVTTTSSPPSAHALDTSGAGAGRGGTQVSGLIGARDARRGDRGDPSSPVPTTVVVRPDRVVGPIGIGGEAYRKNRTEGAEVQLEIKDPMNQVIVGVYANPSTLFADPTQPLPD
jgi:RNA polymerase sigma factor (sigma-70 family)